MNIHPTALISPSAQLASNVAIGPYAIIEGDVFLDEGVTVGAHAMIFSGSSIKKNVQISAYAMIGGLPQVKNFDPSILSRVEVGENTVVREGATIHRAASEGAMTQVGKDCFIMAYAHIGHDCKVGNSVTLTNNVLLGGHVIVEDFANLGGGSAIHQWVKIGEGSMIGGLSIVTADVPPFVMAANRNILYSLNLVGLKRRNIPPTSIQNLKQCFRRVYSVLGDPRKIALEALAEGLAMSREAQHFLRFFEETKRGFIRFKGNSAC